MTKEEARNKSIIEYLKSMGTEGTQKGDKYFFSSPFSSDSNYSFCVYPTNTFFDFSTKIGGDIITLIQELYSCNFSDAIEKLNSTELPEVKVVPSKEKKVTQFSVHKHIINRKKEINLIQKYALSRGIHEKYFYGYFYDKIDGEWIKVLSLGFLHVDENLNITGAKFRSINNSYSQRFSARGKLGFYILENILDGYFEPPTLYIVESETSANSLWEWLKSKKMNSVVISFGGVATIPERLPNKYNNLRPKIIIDYDGNEEKYQQRIKNYTHLGGEGVKIILPKGEDINSLHQKNELDLILNLIF